MSLNPTHTHYSHQVLLEEEVWIIACVCVYTQTVAIGDWRFQGLSTSRDGKKVSHCQRHPGKQNAQWHNHVEKMKKYYFAYCYVLSQLTVSWQVILPRDNVSSSLPLYALTSSLLMQFLIYSFFNKAEFVILNLSKYNTLVENARYKYKSLTRTR